MRLHLRWTLLLLPLVLLYLLVLPPLSAPRLPATGAVAEASPSPSPIIDEVTPVPTPTDLVTPSPAGTPHVVNAGPFQVPILMYHYIRVNPVPSDILGFNLSVTPADFAAQMNWVQAAGYTPITFDDLFAHVDGTQALPAKPIILTFDDGYQDFFSTAFPILASHGFRAVSYVVWDFLGRRGYMTAAEVLQLDQDGIEIGSHTMDHLDLTKLGAAQLRHQVADVKANLESLLGHPVLDFCYPSGRFDAQVVAAVAAAGYRSATTTALAYQHTLADALTWGRVRVAGGESLVQFAAALGG